MAARPDRYRNAIVPHIYVNGASDAIAFYNKAFGAVELFRVAHPSGRILHAEISICGSLVMIGDPDNEQVYGDPRTLGRTTASLHIFVDDNQALLRQASRLAQHRSSARRTCSMAPIPRVYEIPSGMSGCSCPGKRTSTLPRSNGVETRS